jgi:hypothetical protein
MSNLAVITKYNERRQGNERILLGTTDTPIELPTAYYDVPDDKVILLSSFIGDDGCNWLIYKIPMFGMFFAVETEPNSREYRQANFWELS